MALNATALETCAAIRVSCACNQLRRAARAITQRYEQGLAASDLKVTQLPILVALGPGRPLPITPLAEGLGLDRTTLTRNLEILERNGFVETIPDESDARLRLVALTDEGARALEDALPLWRDTHAEIEREFGAARLEALYAELATLTAAA